MAGLTQSGLLSLSIRCLYIRRDGDGGGRRKCRLVGGMTASIEGGFEFEVFVPNSQFTTCELDP